MPTKKSAKAKRPYTKRSSHWGNATPRKTPNTDLLSKDHLINFVVKGVETVNGKKLSPVEIVNVYKTMEGPGAK